MHNILLLTRLQIMEAIGGFKATVEKKTGSGFGMVGTVVLGAALFFGVAWLGFSAYGVLGKAGMDKTVYDILFIACGALTFTFSLPAVLGSFFASSDIGDLLPLPVSPTSIVLAKALGSVASSYLWTMLFIAGPLLGWGIAAGANYEYWVVYMLAVVFAPFMPTAYAGILSIVVATLFKRLRRKDAITTLTTIITLGISVGAFFVSNSLHLSENVSSALGGISDSVGSVVMAFPAYGFAVYAFSHPDPLGTWLFVLLSLAAFAVFVLVARLLYLRVVTSISSSGGKAEAYDGRAAQQQTPVFKSLIRTEVHKVVRNSSVLLNYVAYPLLISPVLFAVMFMTDSMQDALKSLSSLGSADSTIAGFALAFFMVLAALDCCGNKISATAVSREGSNWSHMKVIPVPVSTQLLAKVTIGFVVSALISLVIMGGGAYLLVGKLHVSPIIVAAGAVQMVAAAWLMNCVAAFTESRAPKVDWGNDGDVNARALGGGAAELRSVLVGVIYAATPLLVSPLVRLDPFVFMPVLAAVGIAVAVFVGRALLAKAAQNIEVFE